jgi:hypothetical protein
MPTKRRDKIAEAELVEAITLLRNGRKNSRLALFTASLAGLR